MDRIINSMDRSGCRRSCEAEKRIACSSTTETSAVPFVGRLDLTCWTVDDTPYAAIKTFVNSCFLPVFQGGKKSKQNQRQTKRLNYCGGKKN